MKEIIAIFEPGKPVTIETKGFAGASCKEASKFLEEALGNVVSDTPTREMHQKEQQHIRQGHG